MNHSGGVPRRSSETLRADARSLFGVAVLGVGLVLAVCASCRAPAESRSDKLAGQRALPRIRAAPVTTVLAKLLADSRAEVRRFALEAIVALNDPSFTGTLALAARDPSPEVRRIAVKALVASRQPRVFPTIRLALRDPDNDVRLAALALAELDRSDATVKALLEAEETWEGSWPARMLLLQSIAKHVWPVLVRFIADPRSEVRSLVLTALSRVESPGVVAPVVARVGEPEPLLREARLRVLRTFPGPATTRALLEGLADPVVDVRVAAAAGLAGRSEPAVRLGLAKLARSQDEKERVATLQSLPRCGCQNPQLATLLLASLDDFAKPVQLAAIDGLVSCFQAMRVQVLAQVSRGKPARRASLLTVLSRARARESERLAIGALSDRAPLVRAAATEAIARIAGRDRAAARRLIGHRSTPVRSAVLRSAAPHLADPTIARAVLASLRDTRPEIREAAMSALANGEASVSESLRKPPALGRLLRDRAPGVRRLALRWLAERSESEVSAFLRALSDPHPSVRLEALEALSWRTPLQLPGSLGQFLADREPRIRVAALHLLERTKDRRFDGKVLSLVNDASLEISDAAVHVLGGSRDPRAFDAVLTRLQSGPERRGRFHESMRHHNCVGTQQPTGTLLEALTTISPSRAEPHLIAYLADKRLPGRATAAAMLGRCRSSRARDALIATVRDPSSELREAAASALAAMTDHIAVPVLERLAMRDPAANVRIAASLSLASLGKDRHVWHLLEASRSMEWFVGAPGGGPRMRTSSEIESALKKRCGPGALLVLSRFEEHPRLAAAAAHHLGDCGSRALPLLQRVVRSSLRPAQQAALVALALLGPSGVVIVEGFLKDADPLRRALALAALRKAKRAPSTSQLAAALTSAEPYERLQALRLLLRLAKKPGWKTPPDLSGLVSRLARDPFQGIRETARKLQRPVSP